MDIFDRAQEVEALIQADALVCHHAGRAGPGPGPVVVDGVVCCRECGEEIPAARLAAVPGTGLCVDCAEEADGPPG